MMEELVDDQSRDGSFRNVHQTITCSQGDSMVIETTSFALLAMMKIDFSKWSGHIEKSVDFLMKVIQKGFFGSTQASVLAFKALTEYLKRVEPSTSFPLFQIKINGVANHIQTGNPLLKHKHSKIF